MAKMIFMSLTKFKEEYLPLVSVEEFKRTNIYLISRNITMDYTMDNVANLPDLNPPTWALDKLINENDVKRYLKEMENFYKSADQSAIILAVLMEILKDDKTAIFLCSDEEYVNCKHIEILAKYIKDQWDLRLVDFDKYLTNPKKYLLNRDKLHQLRTMFIELYTRYVIELLENIESPVPRLLFTKQDLVHQSRTVLCDIAHDLNIKSEEISILSNESNVVEIETTSIVIKQIYEVVKKKIVEDFKTESIDDLTLTEILWYCKRLEIPVGESYTKKSLQDRLKRGVNGIENDLEKYSKHSLEALKDYELIGYLKELKLDTSVMYEANGREKAIALIMDKKGIINKDYMLPPYAELKEMKYAELYDIYLNYYNGNPKSLKEDDFRNAKKKKVAKFLIKLDNNKKEIEAMNKLSYNKLRDYGKKKLLRIFKESLFTKDSVERVLPMMKECESPEEILNIAVEELGLELGIEEIRNNIPEKAKLKEMKKKDLYELAINLELSLLPYEYEKKSGLVDLINNERKAIVKEKEREEKNSKINAKNLSKLDKSELLRICRVSKIHFSYEWKKKKLVKALLKFYGVDE